MNEINQLAVEQFKKYCAAKGYKSVTDISNLKNIQRDAWKGLIENGYHKLLISESGGGIGAPISIIFDFMSPVGEELLVVPIVQVSSAIALLFNRLEDSEAKSILESVIDDPSSLAFSMSFLDKESAKKNDLVLLSDFEEVHTIVKMTRFADHATLEFHTVNSEIARSVPRNRIDGGYIFNFEQCDLKKVFSTRIPVFDFEYVRYVMMSAYSALAVGLCKEMIRQTVSYLSKRKQFGKLLSDNQALRHEVVELKICTLELEALTKRLIDIVSNEFCQVKELSECLYYQFFKTVDLVTSKCLQFHGGVGITEELAISHFYRRGMVLKQEFESLTF